MPRDEVTTKQTDRRRVRRRRCRSIASPKCWRCSRAWCSGPQREPDDPRWTSPTKPPPTSTACRSPAGCRGNPFAARYGGVPGCPTCRPHAFEEASVTTGVSSAEFGNAQSGIIAIQTQDRRQPLPGQLRLRVRRSVRCQPQHRTQPARGRLQRPDGQTPHLCPLRRRSKGGSRSTEGFNSQDTPIFVPAGVDTTVHGVLSPARRVTRLRRRLQGCDVHRRVRRVQRTDAIPHPQQLRARLQRGPTIPPLPGAPTGCRGKSALHLRHRRRISLSLPPAGTSGAVRSDPADRLRNARCRPAIIGFHARNNVATFNWTQNLSKCAERALALDVALSYQQDKSTTGR